MAEREGFEPTVRSATSVVTSVDGSAKSTEERSFICERRGRTRGPRSRLSRSSTLISTTSRVTRPSLPTPSRARDRVAARKYPLVSVRRVLEGFQTRHQLDTAEAQYAKYLKLWRSLGESNSCFRRERGVTWTLADVNGRLQTQ